MASDTLEPDDPEYQKRMGEIASVRRMVAEGHRPIFIVRIEGEAPVIRISIGSTPWLHPIANQRFGVLKAARAAIVQDMDIPPGSFDLDIE